MTFSSPIVCFGAGNLGRRVARAVHPVLFCDNNASLWSGTVDGVRVESPETAVKLYPNATFVVAIWYPSRRETMMDRIDQLKSLGAANIVPVVPLGAINRDRSIRAIDAASRDHSQHGPDAHLDDLEACRFPPPHGRTGQPSIFSP